MKILDRLFKEPPSQPTVSEQQLSNIVETMRESAKTARKIAEDLDRTRNDVSKGQTA